MPVPSPFFPPFRCASSDSRALSGSSPTSADACTISRGLRTASFDTASTPGFRSTVIDTSPFIPGRSNPSSFRSDTSTGNIVTLCCTTACGSIFSTVP